MKQPGPSHELDLLAALSHSANFSIACCRRAGSRRHRSVLRELLASRGSSLR